MPAVPPGPVGEDLVTTADGVDAVSDRGLDTVSDGVQLLPGGEPKLRRILHTGSAHPRN